MGEPLDVRHVILDRRELELELGGHAFTVVYRPAVLTIRFFARVRHNLDLLAGCLESWTLTVGEEPLGTTADEIADALPGWFVKAVAEAIVEDSQSGEVVAGLAVGSAPAASSATLPANGSA